MLRIFVPSFIYFTNLHNRRDLDERMRHEIKWSMLFSLRIQICLLSSIEFLCFVCRNDAVQFLYLVLQSIFCKSDICFNGAVVLTCDGCLVDLW